VAINRRVVHADVEDVHAVLSDPSTYDDFVVGTRRIRAADPGWPGRGTRLHHSVGFGVTVLRDETQVRDADPPHRLELCVRIRPFAEFLTIFRIERNPDGALVEIEEDPIGGLAAHLTPRLVDQMIRLRNHEVLRRLARIVEDRRAADPTQRTREEEMS
jgi:hypothetical protein